MTQILRLLLGGSPCTHWSIAQTKHRETEPSGIGWELFQNYLIAKEKYRPDYFLYENNKSMAKAIREQITKELGVEPILINSALVSAQNRQRLYWTNIPGVQQPEDRGILLRDVLDDAVAICSAGEEPRGAAEVLNINPSGRGMNGTVMHINGKSRTITTNKGEGPKIIEPVAPPEGFAMRQVGRRINERGRRDDYNKSLPHIQRYEVNDDPQKTNCLSTVQKDNMVAVPADGAMCVASRGRYTREDGGAEQHLEVQTSGKTNALTTVQKDNLVAQPLELREPETGVDVDGRTNTLTTVLKDDPICESVPAAIAWRGHAAHGNSSSYEMRKDGKSNAVIVGHSSRMVIDSAGKPNKVVKLGNLYGQDTRWGIIGTDGKTPTLTASAGMGGGHVPMWTEPTTQAGNCQKNPTSAKQIYEVRGGKITIRGKQFPIRLPDGFYIIRKLTVSECKRLQTVPEEYIFPVSAAQAYKMLGNGWTVDVVAHILSCCPGIRTEEIEVLSMYDGMSCGQIALDKLGANVRRYCATEIDKYAVQTTQANYPATIQLGDAFQVRDTTWALPQCA